MLDVLICIPFGSIIHPVWRQQISIGHSLNGSAHFLQNLIMVLSWREYKVYVAICGSVTEHGYEYVTTHCVGPDRVMLNPNYLDKPLYDALAAGCTGIEADVWLQGTDLLVGHGEDSMTEERTLQSLYIKPLVTILTQKNEQSTIQQDTTIEPPQGVFDIEPLTPLVLMIDIKSEGSSTFEAVRSSLEPLRSKGCLTHYNGTAITPGPIIVVGSGETPFELINSNNMYRDSFFDAPLDELKGQGAADDADNYTTENFYYASASFADVIGNPTFGVFLPGQDRIREQVKVAKKKGLKARYWDTPTSPTYSSAIGSGTSW